MGTGYEQWATKQQGPQVDAQDRNPLVLGGDSAAGQRQNLILNKARCGPPGTASRLRNIRERPMCLLVPKNKLQMDVSLDGLQLCCGFGHLLRKGQINEWNR